MYSKDIHDRFWSKVKKTSQCWEWTGAIYGRGYGHFGIKINGKHKTVASHRLSYEIHFGKIPIGLDIMHSCDNPPCVNPSHLSTGTRSQNMKDAFDRGRGVINIDRGEKSSHHKLTDEEVREIRRLYPKIIKNKTEIGRRFNISRATIRQIVTRQTWI